MAQIILGKTICTICGGVLEKSEETIGFPAFLPEGHRWWKFSDAAMHSECFARWQDSDQFQSLYEAFKSIWSAVPQDSSIQEREQWLASKLAEYRKSVMG